MNTEEDEFKRIEAEAKRRSLQAAGTHPAPCARHCEAKAFEIEIRSLNSRLKQAQRPWQGLTDDDWDKVGDMPDTFDQGAAWAQARLMERNK